MRVTNTGTAKLSRKDVLTGPNKQAVEQGNRFADLIWDASDTLEIRTSTFRWL
jgi:hypothetical protein